MKKYIFITCFISLALVMSSCEEKENIPDPIELELQVQNASAYNAKDGSVTVNILKGEPPYLFYWNTGDTTRNVSGLGAGNYTMRVIYGMGGSSYYEQTVAVEQPGALPLEISFDVTNVARFGGNTGIVKVNVKGGVAPYTFLWCTGATTATAGNLFANTYTVTVTDSGKPFSITTSKSVSVKQPAFVCGTDSIRDIDGNKYSSVLIGSQCWMAQNLKTTHRPDSPFQPIDGRMCRLLYCQQDEGSHYPWLSVMNNSAAATHPEEEIQGICPAGWHIPTREMVVVMEKWLSIKGNGGDGIFPGAKMKGKPSTSGFDALMAGNWGYQIYNQAPFAAFWTSSQSVPGSDKARMYYVTQDTPLLYSGEQSVTLGLSVRCLKSKEVE
jgi:uncharacterized protein (TIGR02145 family)